MRVFHQRIRRENASVFVALPDVEGFLGRLDCHNEWGGIMAEEDRFVVWPYVRVRAFRRDGCLVNGGLHLGCYGIYGFSDRRGE